MKIQKIISRHRRDFTAIYECEHCLYTYEGPGYDDDVFHKIVIPSWECKLCGKKADGNYRPMGTKYEAHEVV